MNKLDFKNGHCFTKRYNKEGKYALLFEIQKFSKREYTICFDIVTSAYGHEDMSSYYFSYYYDYTHNTTYPKFIANKKHDNLDIQICEENGYYKLYIKPLYDTTIRLYIKNCSDYAVFKLYKNSEFNIISIDNNIGLNYEHSVANYELVLQNGWILKDSMFNSVKKDDNVITLNLNFTGGTGASPIVANLPQDLRPSKTIKGVCAHEAQDGTNTFTYFLIYSSGGIQIFNTNNAKLLSLNISYILK